MTNQNCAIILEEHLKNIKDEKVDLQKKYVDGVEKASTLVRFHPESESELK